MLDVSALEDIFEGMSTSLLSEIRNFLSETGMGRSYFGKISCGNSELVERLEEGKTVTLVTAEKVTSFIRSRRSGVKGPFLTQDGNRIPRRNEDAA